jgi:dimethylsulfone monooxygenase
MPLQDNLVDDRSMLLGTFCLNVSSGMTFTRANPNELDWEENKRVTLLADRTGWDFMLPLGRWRGVGGESDPNRDQFETFTWAAALGAITKRINVFATVHVPLFHPMMAAKLAASIDVISGGRFGINIVAGWNEAEFRMFDVQQREHDDRYGSAEEWLTIMERLWTEEDEVDFEGEFFRVSGAVLGPKPLRKPRPTIISAGSSDKGLDFGLRRADFSFQPGFNLELLRTFTERAQHRAAELDSRTQLLTFGPIVVRDTDAEAQRYFDWYVDEMGDTSAGQALVESMMGGGTQAMSLELLSSMSRAFVAGWGGLPIVGSPETVTQKLIDLREMGFAGFAAGWVNFEEGLGEFNEKVMPLLIDAGLRQAAPVLEDSLAT